MTFRTRARMPQAISAVQKRLGQRPPRPWLRRMPRVRARLLVLAGLLIAGLALPGVALATDGGFAPAGPDSPNGERIETLYWFVMGFAVLIFLIVEVALVFF